MTLSRFLLLGIFLTACSSDDDKASNPGGSTGGDGSDSGSPTSTGGAETGGATSTGGASSTGGTSTGGAGTGGASTGGTTSTGGSTDGGTLPPIDYSQDDMWICKPGLANNPCTTNMDTTVLNADGSTSKEPFTAVTDAPVDCVYLYPTNSADNSPNSDLHPDSEITTTKEQVGRLASVCNVYAPLYRSATLSAITTPGQIGNAFAVAGNDASAAFDYYLKNLNKGRPFILTGHSQGSALFKSIIQKTVDVDATLRKQLVSAVLLGGNVTVPTGKDVGGDFQNVPLCRKTGQTGCLIAYSSYRAEVGANGGPPKQGDLFVFAGAGKEVACTNPAALAGGSAKLAPYFGSNGALLPGLKTYLPSPTTGFVTLPNFVTGECVNENGAQYLAITVTSSSTDKRPQDIQPDLKIGSSWGLHLIDWHIAMGDIVNAVKAQIANVK